MDRVTFKKDFLADLEIVKILASKYLKQGYTVDQVIDILSVWIPSHFGSLSRAGVEEYAVDKASYVHTFIREIVEGIYDDIEIEALCDVIEEKEKIRA